MQSNDTSGPSDQKFGMTAMMLVACFVACIAEATAIDRMWISPSRVYGTSIRIEIPFELLLPLFGGLTLHWRLSKLIEKGWAQPVVIYAKSSLWAALVIAYVSLGGITQFAFQR